MTKEQQETLYDTDFYAWSLEQARKLRAGEPIDVEHVAEEIEDMAKRDRRALRRHMTRIMEHMLKIRLTHGPLLDRNRHLWESSIVRHRNDMRVVLEDSPSLRSCVPAMVPAAYGDAVRIVEAARIAEKPIPTVCPFKLAELLPDDSGR